MNRNEGDSSSDDELESFLERNVNRNVKQIVSRRSLPQQKDLFGQILPNQQPYYEEIQTKVTYGPTHHELNMDSLGTYIYPTNYEVREYQFQIVKKALYENLICAIPTGTGKTFIASTVMLNFYRWTKTAKIIFTAPTRPLVAQQIKACLGVTGIPHSDTAILLDKSRKNRVEIWASKRVFFTTPQVVENDLKRGVLNPKDVACLVIDEAHRARGAYSYVEVTKFMDRFNTSYRLLALTATPAADLEGVQEVVHNLNISSIELRTEEDADVSRYMKRRDKEEINVGLLPEIEDLIEQLGLAVMPVLKEAVELGIYDDCHPSQINAFIALQKSQKLIANPTIPEGIKWRNFFILQLLSHVGHMLKRLKIYGIRAFYKYFENKHKEFTTKYGMGKSTNKTAASFFYNPILKNVMKNCERLLTTPNFLGHAKLGHVQEELKGFIQDCLPSSRVIIFTELRESALEIVKCIDSMQISGLRPHIFIGQARGKEGFDDEEYTRKHKPKGRKKADRLQRLEDEKAREEEKKKEKEKKRLDRACSRTGTSEEAQITGMNQKQQKEVLQNFKDGIYNILVCTSIGEEGLDIGEVDLIICYDATSSPIKNIQRMGRTGRKRDGKVILLLSSTEGKKFSQAMVDYSELQRIVSRNSLEYRQSDRILPSNLDPLCEKKFITIGEEEDELNNIDNSDDVIKFATQAMMGKLDIKKNKATRKKKSKAEEKTFFMPDNVQTGIISASSMVNKFVEDSNGNKIEVAKLEPQVDLRYAVLDSIAFESLNSSPVKPETETSSQLDSVKMSSILARHRHTSRSTDTADTDRTSIFSDPPTSLKRPFAAGTPGNSFDEAMPPLKCNKNRQTSFSGFQPDELSIPLTAKSQESLGSGKMDNNVYKNRFQVLDGLLSSQERRYFEENYSALRSVCIEPVPNFRQYIKTGMFPHSAKTQQLITAFEQMDANTRESILSMSTHKAFATKLENSAAFESPQKLLHSAVVKDSDVRYIATEVYGGSRSIQDNQDINGKQAELSDFLDSDFSDL
ncbi:LANO_0H19702g1_1 [Lachancea nothofagi CBS 11611]|uniref:ATP-dependent DNA helicase n=1 Tax=Lachancea nothofagi CBS 11611 TaxID=1266666 RepID=A0A1G4KN88_9SACH|nr:LANO_0H19702g1_1 [Lachancea nothofagi CBS 11611]